MEGISINAYNGLQRYRKRRSYRRLTTSSSSSSDPSTQRKKVRIQLSRFTPQSHQPPPQPPPSPSSTSTRTRPGPRRRRFWRWRVKIAPKIRLFRYGYSAARKWLTRIRDAYVKMMLRLASSGALGGGGGVGVAPGVGFGGRPAAKEYDERVIVELYKSVLMAERQIAAMSTAAAVAGKKLPEGIYGGLDTPTRTTTTTESCGG